MTLSKLAKAVAATGLTADNMLAHYRKLATVVRVRPLAAPASRDAGRCRARLRAPPAPT